MRKFLLFLVLFAQLAQGAISVSQNASLSFNTAATFATSLGSTPTVGDAVVIGVGAGLNFTPYDAVSVVDNQTIALSGVSIAGTAGQFTCTAASQTLVIGQVLIISGTLGGTGTITGYANPTSYLISATNGSTSFTLTTLAGGALTTTTGTPTGLTYTLHVNVYSKLVQEYDGTGGDLADTEVWWAPALTRASGTFTVTATLSGAAVGAISITEVAGLTGVTDRTFGGNNSSGGSATLTLTEGSANANANDLVFGVICVGQYNTSGIGLSSPASSGYTSAAFINGGAFGVQYQASYKIVSAIETSAATWSWTGTFNAAGVLVTLSGSSSPSVGPSGFYKRF